MNPRIVPTSRGMVWFLNYFTILCLFGLLVPAGAQAQLVADGETNVLNGVVTNVSGGLIVGNTGPFTLLVITNGAMVTNTSGTSAIGNGAAANTNRLVVTGAGSVLNNLGTIYVGVAGSANELDILNGGLLSDVNSAVGNNPSGSGNLAVISDPGSVWTNTSSLYVGNNSSRDTMIVTNGGKVFSNQGGVGQNGNGSNNVVITGAGSTWSAGYTYLGYIGSGIGRNHFLVSNGGNFTSSSWLDIGVYSSTNNLTVADAGSSVQSQFLRMGYSSSANQCVVSNGATLALLSSSQATVVEGTFTTATVTGGGSVWTNAGDLDFGQYSNVLAITSGGKMVDINGYIENGFGKPNTVMVAGTNSLWRNAQNLYVDDSGAQLIITNGGTVYDTVAYFGDNAGNNNCYALVTGAGSVWTNTYNLFVGNNGATNRLVVADSGRVVANMAIYAQYNAGVLVTGTGTLASSYVFIGANGAHSQLVVTNGGTVYAGTFTIGNGQSNTVTLAGGTVFVTNSASLVNHATLVLNSGWFNAGSLSVAGGTQNNLIYLNGGTLQSGSTSYGNVQPFVVGDGTDAANFLLTGNGTHSFPAGVMIASNATLNGTGTVLSDVTVYNGGTIAPGTNGSLGNLVINGNLTLNNGSTTYVKLNAANFPGTSPSDTITGVTNLVYGGTLSLTNLTGRLTGNSYAFRLFSATNFSGAFSSLIPGTPPASSNLRWDTYELNVDGVLRIFPAISLPPVIGGANIANGSLILSAGSGIAYDPCWLLTCTNLAAPVWSCTATNYFDANGNTVFTNPIPAGEPARYFKLQVN